MIIWLQLKRWIKANIFVLNGKNLLFTFLPSIVHIQQTKDVQQCAFP